MVFKHSGCQCAEHYVTIQIIAWNLLYTLHHVNILIGRDSIFSFHYLSVCVFILSAGRHNMLFQCANMYAGTGHSNTNYHM